MQVNRRESVIERKCILIAKARNWMEVKLERCNKNGMPDRMLMKNGRLIFIEFKNDKGALSEIQKHRHEELRKHGMRVYVVHSEILMEAVLDENEL